MESAFRPQSAEDIENRIEELRKSYTPEWKFDRDNPDAGSVIAQIFARQTEENNRLMSQMPERYHMEFVNLLDSSLKPAQPSASIVIFNMEGGTVPGARVPKGTRLSASSDKTESGSVIFETERNLYVTNAKIKAAFMTDAERGTFTPVFGDFNIPEIVTGTLDSIRGEEERMALLNESAEELAEAEEVSSAIPPFTLFGEKEDIGRSILIIYEERLFDGAGESVYIRFTDADDLIQRVQSGDLVFKYFADNGFNTFDEVTLLEDNCTFLLVKSRECRKTSIGERKYSVVILESQKTMTDSLGVSDVLISAGGDSRAPEYVGDGIKELEKRKFAPFSDELAVYNECYIGHSPCFSKKGSKITITFKASYKEAFHRITPEQEEAELAIIKLKPKKLPFDIPTEAKVEEIIIEYFNGIGWKKLVCDAEYDGMFKSCEPGDYKLSFICPDDWEISESGPYSGRCLRMRIVKATNCYMRPAIHMYPEITDLKISYSYEGKFVRPKRLERIAGTKKTDITAHLALNKSFTVLSGNDYHEDALYIGIDKKLTEGPISLYFQLSDNNNQSGVRCRLEYSGPSGFSEMRITDLTEDFTRSGAVMFMPSQDMTESVLEGNRLYWLKLVRSVREENEKLDAFLPKIVMMCMNAVIVSNIQTSDEQDYYIEEVLPNASISLGVDNILDAFVWVNEKGYTRREEMEELLNMHPERVRAEYDFLGRISAFYVLWDEVDSFNAAPHKRCYRIDRMSGKIIFSDGTKCDIPRVTDDIAFKARIRSTDGYEGNLAEGEISTFLGQEAYIDTVYNPIRAHGGSNLETIDHALLRCAGILHSRYKLVSETDYYRFCMDYSDSIDKAKIVVGQTIDGQELPEDISVVLLMKDYADGAFSFHRVSAALQREMLKFCEVTISEKHLHIVEPVFVDVSVNVWAKTMNMDDAFEVQSEVKTVLNDYLDPVGNAKENGWDIGTLPKESQILMRLGILRNKAIIQRITMIGHYIDADGEHEMDTKDIKITPFMVVRSGKHTVNITNK
ncbi:hypothetical protein [Butyrivibrio sp. AE3004]|uniref:hypothetical protein n=1 Tax=Butyrivibrio sp. AE3004 TaxID=1506994 RepID=UPI00055F3D46|nr:hypothetical protein [Butyrivibrio sp. AE3004]